MHISLYLPSGDFQVSLRDPADRQYPWDLNATAYNCLLQPFEPDTPGAAIGYVYHLVLKNPLNGLWQVQGSSAAGVSSDWSLILNANFVSEITAGLFISADMVPVNTPVSASLAVMDAGAPAANFSVISHLLRSGDPAYSQPISFAPVTNPMTGNTTLVAQFQVLDPGEYVVKSVINGTVRSNPFERMAVTTFTAHPRGAQLIGPPTQRVEISYP
jgi:hypothetical protein